MTFTGAGSRGISEGMANGQEVADPQAVQAVAHPDSSGPSATPPAVSSAGLETGLTPMIPQAVNAPRNIMRIIMRTGRLLRRLISACITGKGMKKSRRFMVRPNRRTIITLRTIIIRMVKRAGARVALTGRVICRGL